MADFLFIGDRQEKRSLAESLVGAVASISQVRDAIGWKLDNVFQITLLPDGNSRVKQFLPTPHLTSQTQSSLTSSGVVDQTFTSLSDIPRSMYNREDLKTTAVSGEEKYWIIDGEAYITKGITKKYLTWNVQIERYENYNRDELRIPPIGRFLLVNKSWFILSNSNTLYISHQKYRLHLSGEFELKLSEGSKLGL